MVEILEFSPTRNTEVAQHDLYINLISLFIRMLDICLYWQCEGDLTVLPRIGGYFRTCNELIGNLDLQKYLLTMAILITI